MRILSLLLLSILGLHAGSVPLSSYLESVESSNAVGALKAQSEAQAALQRSQVQSEGFLLNGEVGYASEKSSDLKKAEYHVSIEKRFLFGDSGAYADALKISSQKQQELQLYQLKTVVYEHYINACTLKEKAGLLKDAQDRNIELTKLIDEGVKGGEFDRSSLLRSELIVDELQLRISALENQYYEELQSLQLYTRKENNEEPFCQDLPSEIAITENPEQYSTLYQYLESEITATSTLKNFRAAAVQDIKLGVGYDNEIDLSRGIVFMQIPLTQGSRRNSEREAATQAKLAAQQQLLFAKAQIESQIRTYTAAQQTRKNTFDRLNDVLIPKAYESSVLLLERFMGSEGSYLSYIDSQKALFDLIIQGIDTRANALLAQAKLYRTLGVDPQKDIK
jgi:outer membrane protein TolC